MSKSPVPKVALDPHPPQYRTPVPSAPLPRDPRIPSDMPELLPTVPATRDTDPVTAHSGEYEVADDADKTPVETLYGLRSISRQLDEVIKVSRSSAAEAHAAANASRDAANAAIATRSELRVVVDEVKTLSKRVTALELSSKWAPLTISAVSLTLVLWLAFQAQQTQAQVQALQAQIQLLKPAKAQ